MARRPAVAGMFYKSGKASLVESIESCFVGELGPGRCPAPPADNKVRAVVGLVSPHAGYVYSGAAAAHAYLALAEDGFPDTAIILGPNHHGLGAAVSISTQEAWATPLGDALVDLDAAKAILSHSQYAREDEQAHLREHSVEVQVPFLQYIGGGTIRIVPIAIAHLAERDAALLVADLGSAIAKAIEGKNAVVISSTDFTHYESKSIADAKDALALERIAAMDPAGLLGVVESNSITMCGVTGTAVMIEACKGLGASSARILTHYTSGDVTGDMTQVVGYAAATIER